MLDRIFIFFIDIFLYHLLVSFIYGVCYSIKNRLYYKTDQLLGYSRNKNIFYLKNFILTLWLGFKYGVLLSIPFKKNIRRQKLY